VTPTLLALPLLLSSPVKYLEAGILEGHSIVTLNELISLLQPSLSKTLRRTLRTMMNPLVMTSYIATNGSFVHQSANCARQRPESKKEKAKGMDYSLSI
jgi:hypothetical protein